MTVCNHSTLTLLPEQKKRLRCRQCHLTIKADELGESYCPECFEMHGKKHYDFEELVESSTEITLYRCEGCGIIIKSD